MKSRLWSNLCNNKYKCFYIKHLIEKYQRTNRLINSLLAVTSLTSVSLWAIWNVVPWLWAIIIGASNVFLAIKPFLEYDKRIKVLVSMLTSLEEVQFGYEELWHDQINSKKKNKKLSKNFFKLYNKQIITLTMENEIILSQKKIIAKKAKTDYLNFLKHNYGIDKAE